MGDLDVRILQEILQARLKILQVWSKILQVEPKIIQVGAKKTQVCFKFVTGMLQQCYSK